MYEGPLGATDVEKKSRRQLRWPPCDDDDNGDIVRLPFCNNIRARARFSPARRGVSYFRETGRVRTGLPVGGRPGDGPASIKSHGNAQTDSLQRSPTDRAGTPFRVERLIFI